MNQTLIIAIFFHRIGVVIVIIPIFIDLILPQLFPSEDDLNFAKNIDKTFKNIIIIGSIILILSGMVRLIYISNPFIIIKIILAIITLTTLFYNTDYESVNYIKINLIRLALILVTGLAGIII